MLPLISSFFEANFWQLVLGEVLHRLFDLILLGLMSGAAIALYTRVKHVVIEWKEVVIWWSLLTALLFLVSIKFSVSPPPPPQIVVAPIPPFPAPAQASWPPALTKTEIDNWSLALKPYRQKVTTVIIAFLDIGQKDFVTGLAQTMSQAQWPEPSLQPGTLNVGARIMASKDVFEAAQQLQQLMETKTGHIRLDKSMQKDKAGKPITGFIVVYAGLKPQ